MRVRVVTCLVVCLAALAGAASAQADQPGSVSAGPPQGAVASGGTFVATPKAAHGKLSPLANAAFGGCYFIDTGPHVLGNAIFDHSTFTCQSNTPVMTASGCLYFQAPNNSQWYAIACNSTGWQVTTRLFLAIASGSYGCHTYEAWGAFSAQGPFAFVNGLWFSYPRYLC